MKAMLDAQLISFPGKIGEAYAAIVKYLGEMPKYFGILTVEKVGEELVLLFPDYYMIALRILPDGNVVVKGLRFDSHWGERYFYTALVAKAEEQALGYIERSTNNDLVALKAHVLKV